MRPDFYVIYKGKKEVGRYDTLIAGCRDLDLTSSDSISSTITGLANHYKGHTAREGYNDPELDQFAYHLYKHFRMTFRDIEDMYGSGAIKKHTKEFLERKEEIKLPTPKLRDNRRNLTEETVYKIYELNEEGMSEPDIAREVGTSSKNVHNIINREYHKRYYDEWHGTEGQFDDPKIGGRVGFKKDELFRIYEMVDSGMTQKEVAEIFNVSQGAISQIKLGKSYEHYYNLYYKGEIDD